MSELQAFKLNLAKEERNKIRLLLISNADTYLIKLFKNKAVRIDLNI